MTREEKDLLFKDLCARFPYQPMCEFTDTEDDFCTTIATLGYALRDFIAGKILIKPYLRPMSSMTEKEREEYRNLSDEVVGSYGPYHREFIAHCVRLGIKPDNPHECVDDFLNMDAIDWLNAHHFDYRGLIEKGLALEAPEGMYK